MKGLKRMIQSPRYDEPTMTLPWQAHRLRGPVTLDDICQSTKISKRFLEAIESGDYAQLPGGVFTTNYIRQYAEAISYDAELILGQLRGSDPVTPPVDEPRSHNWTRHLLFGLGERS